HECGARRAQRDRGPAGRPAQATAGAGGGWQRYAVRGWRKPAVPPRSGGRMVTSPAGGPKAVLVTGAARRGGRAIAEALAADGWFVCIHCNRSVEDAAAVQAGIAARGGRAAVFTADLTDVAATERLVPEAAAASGGLT